MHRLIWRYRISSYETVSTPGHVNEAVVLELKRLTNLFKIQADNELSAC